jgi:hypothetical protein
VTSAPDVAASSGGRWLLPLVTGVAGVVLGAAGALGAGAIGDLLSRDGSRLPNALSDCGATSSPTSGFLLGDDDRSLTFDDQGEKDASGADTIHTLCVLDALDIPSAVLSHVEQTTSLDGRQKETWGGVTLAWSYHPDRGLDGVITVGG